MNRALQWLGLICLPGVAHAEGRDEDAPSEVRIRAEKASLDAGWIEAEGRVFIELGEQQLEGEGFRYHAESGLLTIEQGQWTSGDRVLRFEEAELRLAEETGRLVGAALRSGGWTMVGT